MERNIEFQNGTLNNILQVKVPTKTSTYSPVSHSSIMTEIEEQLDKKSLNITNKSYKIAQDGKRVIGYYDIDAGNSDMGMRLAWRNSYDKSMSAAFVAGSNVWICSNGMISGDIKFMRKHTGTIVTELQNKIVEGIDYLDKEFNQHLLDKENMSKIYIDKTISAELCGRLFIEEDIINSTQLNIIKKELEESTYQEFTNPDLWSFYNKITHALKTSHPMDYIDRHVNLHKFVEVEFSI